MSTRLPCVVAILYARADSIYKTLPGCDVWDAERDARKYRGPFPVVAHPPCRAWGRLRTFAKPRFVARDVRTVTRNGERVQEPVQKSRKVGGGRQLDMLVGLIEPTACSSAYGLCDQ